MGYYNIRLGMSNSTYLDDIGWDLANIPVLTHSQKNRDRFSIPLRDGELLGSDIWSGNAYVTLTMHTRIENDAFAKTSMLENDNVTDRLNRLYSYLEGKKELWVFTRHTQDAKYEVLGYNITSETRKSWDYARVEVQFEVYPYKFIVASPEYTTLLTITNPFDDAMPLYEFTMAGSAGATQSITVNGNVFTFKRPSNLSITKAYIDVRKQIVYYTSGGTKYEITGTTGDFRGLILPSGDTSVITLSSGASLTTYPRWGYKI